MSTPLNPKSLSDKLKSRVAKAVGTSKSAAESNPPSDPTNKGVAGLKPDPAGNSSEVLKLPPHQGTNPKTAPNNAIGTDPKSMGDAPPEAPARVGTPEIDNIDNPKVAKIKATLSSINTKMAKVLGTDTAAAAAPAAAAGQQKSASLDASMENNTLIKLSQLMLSSERGKEFAETMVAEAMGVEEAARLVKDAALASNQYSQQELQQEHARREYIKRAAEHAQQQQAIFDSYSEEGKAFTIKMASYIEDRMLQLPPIDQELFKLGMADASVLLAGGGAPPEGMPPEAGAMPEDPAAAMGAPDETAAPSPEELLALVQQLVESGQLPQEVAQQLMAALGGEVQETAKAAAVSLWTDDADLQAVLGDVRPFIGLPTGKIRR